MGKIDLKDPNILNVYRFGSHVYGTNTPESDEDFIVVVQNYVESENKDIHFFTINSFQNHLNELDIQMLECYFLPEHFILKKEHEFKPPKIDLSKLRASISKVSSHSWEKGHKKLTTISDYEKNIGLKSLFHSLRIRHYGIQLATDGKISDWSKLNHIYFDLLKFGTLYERDELWNRCNEKYGGENKKLRSHFISLCPKPDNYRQKKDRLIKLFKKHNIDVKDEKIYDDIINTLGNK